MPMVITARKPAVSVPAILLALAVLACLLIAHGLYGLLVLFGPPDISPEATLLTVLALCFLLLLLAAAAAAGNRRALLLPREEPAAGGDHVDVIYGASFPTTAEEAAVGAEEPHHQIAADEGTMQEEEAVEARRAGLLQTQDYPGSGANSRHDPRNPH